MTEKCNSCDQMKKENTVMRKANQEASTQLVEVVNENLTLRRELEAVKQRMAANQEASTQLVEVVNENLTLRRELEAVKQRMALYKEVVMEDGKVDIGNLLADAEPFTYMVNNVPVKEIHYSRYEITITLFKPWELEQLRMEGELE
jgi:regulator of replication initiation timing